MGSLATELTNIREAETKADSKPDSKPDSKNDAADASLGNLAHELRQPLSNIEAIAYYLSMILPPGDEKIQAQLARIRELVEQSNSILSTAIASALSPAAPPQPMAPPA